MSHILSRAIRSAAILAVIIMATIGAAAATPSGNTTANNGIRPLKFAWGAELGGGVEMSGHDMSTLGINASFGMEWQWIRFLGITAEADIMVDNSSRSFPISLNFRTDFSRRRRLLFMDLRGGIALNYFDNNPQTSNPYASGGIGVTLAAGKSFSSHIILAYTYLGRDHCSVGDRIRNCPGMSYATMRLGVQF